MMMISTRSRFIMPLSQNVNWRLWTLIAIPMLKVWKNSVQ